MMMKKSLLAATLVLFGMTTLPAMAEEYSFTIVNDTGYTIEELYIDDADSDEWGDDLLGDEDLPDGEEMELTYEDDDEDEDDETLYDAKLVWDDGSEDDEWEDLDLSEASQITFHYDEDSDETSATIE